MKTKDIASKYGINREKFEKFAEKSGLPIYNGGFSLVIDDQYVSESVEKFKQYESDLVAEMERNAKEAADEEARKLKEEPIKREALANMLITSGFNFDGYTITKYSGYISGDDAVEVDRGTSGLFSRATNVGESLMASLVTIRRNALMELKEAAYALGCNAVIGVDFDYLTLDPQTATATGGTMYLPYVFGVTANGNAVIIEKNKTPGEA